MKFKVLPLRLDSFVTETKEFGQAGTFKGYASTRKRDSAGDVVVEGAFKRTIEQNDGKVPILAFHDPRRPVGMTTLMKEDGHGLYVEGFVDLDTEAGRDQYQGMRKGYIDRMSIGYRVLQEELDGDTLLLKEVKLLEISLVTRNFAANDEALITEVKGLHMDALMPLLRRATALKEAAGDGLKLDDRQARLVRDARDALGALLEAVGPAMSTQQHQDPPGGVGDPAQATLLRLKREMQEFAERVVL